MAAPRTLRVVPAPPPPPVGGTEPVTQQQRAALAAAQEMVSLASRALNGNFTTAEGKAKAWRAFNGLRRVADLGESACA